METLLLPAVAAIASGVSVAMGVAIYLRVRSIDKAEITVLNKQTGKTATLPRDYSPAAVDKLLEVTS